MKKIISVTCIALLCALLFTACKQSAQDQIIGDWSDSLRSRGYSFGSDGAVKITFFSYKLPKTGRFSFLDGILNLIDQGLTWEGNGSYTLNEKENTLTVRYTLYNKTVTDVYGYAFTDGNLTLTDLEDSSSTTFFRQGAQSTDNTNPN